MDVVVIKAATAADDPAFTLRHHPRIAPDPRLAKPGIQRTID
ncbi:hypothetical protein ACWF94_00600 [Streptomyces sp. NPDC055078]